MAQSRQDAARVPAARPARSGRDVALPLRADGAGAADLVALAPEERELVLGTLSAAQLVALSRHWPYWRCEGQAPPPGDWHVWLMLAGRGFGKTRLGAQWVRAEAAANPQARIALVAATMAEVRAVMIEGESGLLAATRDVDAVHWEPSLGRLTWGNGAQAFAYSAECPEALRGPQHHLAWCDELVKWKQGEQLWDNLMLGLRLGERPRALVTTTPRSTALIKRLIKTDNVHVCRGAMYDNPYLSDSYRQTVEALYAGTLIGRQELDGELLSEVEGALWTHALIDATRVRVVPPLRRVVVAVDPPASVGGDACGIVAVGLGADDHGYLLEDASVSGLRPEGWAEAVAACAARHGADMVVAEANNGGAMVETILRGAERWLPLRLVHASRGKVSRAEPVSLLYHQGIVHHCGSFAALEDELCGLLRGGGYDGPNRSPDRADALVWALTHLFPSRPSAEPRVRCL